MAREITQRDDDRLDTMSRGVVSDLHTPKPAVFWVDLLSSAVLGWGAFAIAAGAAALSPLTLLAGSLAGFVLYRGVSFTHELAHLRRSALPGFETSWNVLIGVPLLLPSFTYLGVHQSHHNLSTYGTKDDPEYLPFANSRKLMMVFAVQSTLLLPILMIVRFLVLAPVALVWPRLHRWLEVHASSFAMNPDYCRDVSPETMQKIRRWEIAILAFWGGVFALIFSGALPARVLWVWFAIVVFISFLNTVRVLGAHEYESDGRARTRQGQLRDSIDTPGGPWTELWAPVGLRYHALHHYHPGIPYHNLGIAYRRLVRALPPDSVYADSTSPSLRRSLMELYAKAKRGGAALAGATHDGPAEAHHGPAKAGHYDR
jgi:fatty acid desaturase